MKIQVCVVYNFILVKKLLLS